jgi:peptidoglycan/LPS O-acetylase OafA/YrhL
MVGLDVLRFVAVFLVLGRHVSHLDSDTHGLFASWRAGGWVGVDIFFVLSGFLVSGLLFDEFKRTGRIDSKRFLVRRAWKIYPAFWAMIAFTLFMRIAFRSPDSQSWAALTKSTIAELLFVQNYIYGLWGHTWTLAVEEHFYVALVLLLATLAIRSPAAAFREIPAIFLAVAVICLSLRMATVYSHRLEPHDWFAFCGTHLRIDSLLFGVLISYLCHFRDFQKRIASCPTALLLGGGILGLTPPFFLGEIWGSAVWAVLVIGCYLASGALVLAATRLRTTSSSALLVFASLGAVSYSIYLWHVAVNAWGTRAIYKVLGARSDGLYLATYLFGSFALGLIMSRLIEMPTLALRDKWFPSRRKHSLAPVEPGISACKG